MSSNLIYLYTINITNTSNNTYCDEIVYSFENDQKEFWL